MLNQFLKVRCSQCQEVITLSITEQQYLDWKKSNQNIQDYFPNVSADERELLISGVCGKCFDKMFAEDEIEK